MFFRKRDLYKLSTVELTDTEKREHVESLESDREAVIMQIEELMRDIAKASGKRRLGKRKKLK